MDANYDDYEEEILIEQKTTNKYDNDLLCAKINQIYNNSYNCDR